MEEMRTLSPSPSRYGSRLRLAGFPISDMFGQEATAVVTNEAAGVSEARKKRTARSLPLPGVRGAMARGEDFGYVPSVGAFLASAHVAQEVAWLQGEVTWSMVDGTPPLRPVGGALRDDAAPPAVRFEPGSGAMVIPAGGARLRCHALLFVLRVQGVADGTAVAVELAALEAGEWQSAASFEMPGEGTYLGLVALDKRPRTIEAVRVALTGAPDVEIYDLALLTFG